MQQVLLPSASRQKYANKIEMQTTDLIVRAALDGAPPPALAALPMKF
jgi:hypothetical protein